MNDERQAIIEANELTEKQLEDFYKELRQIPSPRSPITGEVATLAFEFMEDTGCRVNETIHVKKEDINFRTRILTVKFPKSESICKCSRWKYKDLHTRIRVLESVNANCNVCKGKGKWKKPQITTITPRLIHKLKWYCDDLKDDNCLFPITRNTLYRWGKEAGIYAGINIFQQKKEKLVEGIFLHLFRALCSKRMITDAMNDKYKDQLVACKLRHSFSTVTDRYTKIDVNYLWSWEEKTYPYRG